MGNTWFQMKAFTVHQPQAALKVGTDACLFGAWVGKAWQEKIGPDEALLDIGTGTGLLSLMLRQVCRATVHAVEIDPLAYQDAATNFEQSPWKTDLRLYLTDIRQFSPQPSTLRFKGIISNPPFFVGNLKSNDPRKNKAKHEEDLPLRDLLTMAERWLEKDGELALLLPANRSSEAEEMFNLTGWNIRKELRVKQSPQHADFRVAYLLQRASVQKHTESICIRETDQVYSTDFQKLLAPFYLYL